jgi:hypothetical protein
MFIQFSIKKKTFFVCLLFDWSVTFWSVPPAKSMSLSEVVFKQPEPSNISIIEIRLENGINIFSFT